MSKAISLEHKFVIFGTPLLILAAIILMVESSAFDLSSNAITFGITIDLLLTTPFIYFLLIRNTNIPNTTVVPFLILGMIIGTFLLPTENQYFLELFKIWVFPIIELTIIGFVVYQVHKAIKEFKKRKDLTFDFFATLKEVCYELLPKLVVMPVVTEIAVFYYGFVYWRKRKLSENEFSYHKESTTVALLITIIFLVAIETFVFHILLSKWSVTAAWIFTMLSIYSAIQILGFLKSIIKRPISIENNTLKLRYGILSETFIDIRNISSIELTDMDITFDKETRKLSPLGELEGHNVVIRLNRENTLTGLYGMKRKFKTLALHVDNKARFKEMLEYTR
jgi:hypothetical protein